MPRDEMLSFTAQPQAGSSLHSSRLRGCQPGPANLIALQHPLHRTKQMSMKGLSCKLSHGSETIPPHTPTTKNTHRTPRSLQDRGGGRKVEEKRKTRESRSLCSSCFKKVGWISPKSRPGTLL